MNPLLQAIKDVSMVGTSPVLFVIVLVLLVFFWLRKDYLRVFLIGLSLGSGLYNTGLKAIFRVARPPDYVADGFIQWERFFNFEVYSFPSSHTVLYTAFFGYLIYLTYKIKGVDKLVRHSVRIASFLLVSLVGGSRVLIGAHYIRDVIAGYIFGFIYLLFLIAMERFLAQKLSNKLPKRREP
ncbi:phosphatase PAP2 family protein [Patescibacteria group bacterium]|nr:phosphatase PAP2 family protein [Patescibacteria group bacterium]